MTKISVIPAAGLGTRLLMATKEVPKEMLPVFDAGPAGYLCVKPLLQVIYEKLYDVGFRTFCFIVGRGKRAIEDHFSCDWEFVRYLESRGKTRHAEELASFYKRLERSTIMFVNQPEPKGFGDAIYRVKELTRSEPFLVHAGDDLVLSSENSHIVRLMRVFYEKKADAAFLIEEVEDPRRFGVIRGVKESPGVYRVVDVVEKPETPPSRMAIVAIYVFNDSIYDALEKTGPGYGGEIQLTDAIGRLIIDGGRVFAVKLLPDEKRIDISTPDSYWNALRVTYEYTLSRSRRTL